MVFRSSRLSVEMVLVSLRSTTGRWAVTTTSFIISGASASWTSRGVVLSALMRTAVTATGPYPSRLTFTSYVPAGMPMME